jgi:hypothetical protein
MIKKLFVLILLLLCSACVSRTIIAADNLTGEKKEVIKDQKLIWFWQSEFYQ